MQCAFAAPLALQRVLVNVNEPIAAQLSLWALTFKRPDISLCHIATGAHASPLSLDETPANLHLVCPST